jgi:hypothetical protein
MKPTILEQFDEFMKDSDLDKNSLFIIKRFISVALTQQAESIEREVRALEINNRHETDLIFNDAIWKARKIINKYRNQFSDATKMVEEVK